MKKHLLLLSMALCLAIGYSQEETIDPDEIMMDSTLVMEQYLKALDSINNSFAYETGTIEIGDGIAVIEVPEGFKFLNAEQSQYVMTELWGNPPSETLGLLFPEDMTPFHEAFTYCVEISFEEEGYIEDDDAEDLDYDELLEGMQKDIKDSNPERIAAGYPAFELVGWASPPYYDKEAKKLHWAKELHFEDEEANTLNYNIRVLGRKGFLVLNAIGDIDMLETFNRDRDLVIQSVEFTSGNRYADFNPDIDEVAAYGIGGLIAGKVLAKVGFFALLLKFWKIIAIAVVAFFGGMRKKLFGRKKEVIQEETIQES